MTIYPKVTNEAVNDAYTEASRARNRLTTVVDNNNDDDDQKIYTYYPKVCCICDRLIKHKTESFININQFTGNSLIGNAFHKEKVENVYNLNRWARRSLNKQYTQRFFPQDAADDSDEIELLDKMILSPRSYGRVVGKKKELGCCVECKNGIRCMTRKDRDNTGPPKHAVVNGLMIGAPPKVLQNLNEVELAMISLARSEKHIFSYSGEFCLHTYTIKMFLNVACLLITDFVKYFMLFCSWCPQKYSWLAYHI